MGYLSCNTESSISTCDSYNWKDLTKNPIKRKNPKTKPFNLTQFSYSDLHSATNGFSPSNFLGKGSHGSVFKAHFNNTHHHLIAAVKRTTSSSSNFTNNPAENEVEILSCIQNHPRIVNLIGFSVDSEAKKLLIVEYMPNGSLYDLLHLSTKPPSWVQRVRFALQIAKAVHFLHSSNPPVIHRDIKSSNVLIDGGFHARLSDFGLALRGHVEDVRVKCTPPAGTLGYLDPCYLAPGDLSPKSDVFSFGILLLEMISGRNAIDVSYSPPSVVDWAVPAIKSGECGKIFDPRIGSPEDVKAIRKLAVLAARCVRAAAEKRPGMAEVVEWLKDVRKRVNSVIWSNLRRRVVRVKDSCGGGVNYEQLDESFEINKGSRIGCRRNRKVSSVTSTELRNGGVYDQMVRSKSIGSVREIKFGPFDLNNNNQVGLGKKKLGLAVKMPMVRLSKSRSMGVLQGTRLVNNANGVVLQLMRNPNVKELEESKMLVNLHTEPHNHKGH